jgi:hypothetical protein
MSSFLNNSQPTTYSESPAMISPTARRWLFLVSLSILCGCQGRAEPRAQVNGQVLANAKPLSFPSNQRLRVVFCKLGENGHPSEKSFSVLADRRARFTATVPEGSYRILVRLIHGDKDLLHDTFGFRQTPFIREIRDGDTLSLELGDVDKKMKNRASPANRPLQ